MTGPTDPIDQRIMAELRSNGRISHAQLGDKVLLSRNAVRQRIERLERAGHIAGYTIREPRPKDSAVVTALLLISRRDRVRGVDVVAALRALPEVVTCDVVSGELDLVVRVEARDNDRIQEIWQLVSELAGVRDITTAYSLSTVIDRRK